VVFFGLWLYNPFIFFIPFAGMTFCLKCSVGKELLPLSTFVVVDDIIGQHPFLFHS
jgi:hypothetical protein